MIRVRDLRVEYGAGIRALNGVNLDVAAGEFVALIGPSGAGKSTFLRCLNGLVTPGAGEVSIEGRRLTGAPPAEVRHVRAQIGFVFQQFNLLRRQSVLANVLVGRLARVPALRSLTGWFPRPEVERARRALERVGLGGLEARRVDTLSGGQQQRVAIARALVQEPKILLADEPMASLDPALADSVMTLLRSVNEDDGITVVTSLHVLDLARRYGRRVVGLRAGALAYDGPPTGLGEAEAAAIFTGTAVA